MYRRKLVSLSSRKGQTGAVLMLFVFMIAIGLTSFALKYYTTESARLAQEDETANALAQAKAALVGIALSDTNRPGHLPCPEDTSKIGTASEGEALASCNTDPLRIGRLPWKTLGAGRFLDGQGEPLWYAVSAGFENNLVNPTPINSETTPQLSINGVANSAIAIVFSPGTPLSNQNRLAISSSTPPSQSDYLDQGNADGDSSFFRSIKNNSFNDKLIVISHADIIEPLEKRVLGEIRNNVAVYKDGWFAYPFPVKFENPTTKTADSFIGEVAQRNIGGLLPVSDPLVMPDVGLANMNVITGNGGVNVGQNCTADSDATICNKTLTPQTVNVFGINIGFFSGTGTANFGFSGVGKGFISPPTISCTEFGDLVTDSLFIVIEPVTPGFTANCTSTTKKLDSNGNAIYTVNFSLNYFGINPTIYTLRAGVRSPKYPNIPATWTSQSTSWLIKNNWHRLIYYKISDPFSPSGSTSSPVCASNCLLSVRRTYNGITSLTTDVPGILMTAGKALVSTDFQPSPGQNRTDDALKEYFDSAQNQDAESTSPITFDQILPLKSTFNDQLQRLQ